MAHRLRRPLIRIVCLVLPACFACVQSTSRGADDIDPAARRALEQVAAAYREVAVFHARAPITRALTAGDENANVQSEARVAFQRPDKLAISVDGVEFVTDGKTAVTASNALRKYRKQTASSLTLPGVMVGPVGSMLAGGPAESPVATILTLVLGADPVGALLEGATSLQVQDGGRVLVLKRPPRPDLRLTIDPATHFVVSIQLDFDPARLKETASPGLAVDRLQVTWDLSKAQHVGPLDPAAFVYEPAAGFSEVAVAQPKPAEKPERHRLVGKEAPDFRVTTLEPGDKTQTLTRADLAGKVVVLDFWATWCPPCREELPEIQQLAERMAIKHAGKVMIIALSQDRAPEDESPLRGLVEGTLAELKVTLAKSPVAKVGLDPNQDVGDAFGVEGIPMIVVIDGQGVVQAVHVGYREGVGDELAEQVESLLAGKSLLIDPAPQAIDTPAGGRR